MALAMCDILLTTPLAIFTICLNAKVSPLQPWISWEDTHYDYWRIGQLPAFFWKKNHTLVIVIEFTRWVIPICAFIFFAFFGFADEARRYYSRLFRRIVGPLSQSKKSLLDTSDSATMLVSNYPPLFRILTTCSVQCPNVARVKKVFLPPHIRLLKAGISPFARTRRYRYQTTRVDLKSIHS
jgi:hypothetical protein